jgi:hypothetical protein
MVTMFAVRTLGIACVLLVACGPGPATEFDVAWSARSMRAGEPLPFEVKVEVTQGKLAEGAELRLLFPHWWYGQRPLAGGMLASARRPADAREAAFGRWYVASTTDRALGSGESLQLRVDPFFAPVAAMEAFEPIVLLRRAGSKAYVRLEPSSPPIRIDPGPGEELVAVTPLHATPGEVISVRLRLQDSLGNPVGPGIPAITARVPTEPGLHWLPLSVESAAGPQSLRAGPILVTTQAAGGRRLVFADLHGHSAASDGAGTAAQWFRYARDVAFLDAAALTDHDWQLDPGEWSRGIEAADAANVPGDFTALPALETNRFGHEVLYFPEPSCLPASLVAAGGSTELWEETDLGRPAATPAPGPARLASRCADSVLTVTHTSLAPGMGTAFPLPAAPHGYSAIEIYSAHGSSECQGCPRAFGPGPADEPVGSVRQALDNHGPMAFIAAGDSHDGRPGNSRWGAWSGGLTGLWVEELSRAGVAEALRSGHSFATTGPRASLELEEVVGGMRLRIVAPQDLREIVVVRNGEERALAIPAQGRWMTWQDPEPQSRRWAYVRVTLVDGNMIWSSPIGPPAPSSD